jgi:hypothetical protein
MERDFYNEDFEDLIKQKADQYRMYPSDKVWKGIHNTLHPRRKWYWSGFVLLLSFVSYFSIDALFSSNSVSRINTPSAPKDVLSTEELNPFTPAFSENAGTKKTVPLAKKDNDDVASVEQDGPSGIALAKIIPIETPLSLIRPLFSSILTEEITDAPEQPSVEEANNSVALSDQGSSPENSVVVNAPAVVIPTIPTFTELASGQEVPAPPAAQESDDATFLKSEQADAPRSNWLQEFALYELSATKTKRLSFQFTLTPTMNYRKLTGNKNSGNYSAKSTEHVPIALNLRGEVDNFVNHHPALGFELGSFALYRIRHNISLKAGAQFNYTRYDIKAYTSSSEVATIALSNAQRQGADSISNYSNIRNFGGYAVTDLKNQYFMLSVPVGVEMKVLGNKRLQLFVAGTVQPTYLLNGNPYLITTDYKSYTREPSLIRRWNLNTAAEAFLSYSAAGVRWQVGPQFRYQLFSSYANEYPIKEYLMEYGVKIGITKAIR